MGTNVHAQKEAVRGPVKFRLSHVAEVQRDSASILKDYLFWHKVSVNIASCKFKFVLK